MATSEFEDNVDLDQRRQFFVSLRVGPWNNQSVYIEHTIGIVAALQHRITDMEPIVLVRVQEAPGREGLIGQVVRFSPRVPSRLLATE